MAGDRIEVTDGPARGEESELDKGLVIGRSTEGFGALKGDPEISRRHAQISRTDEGRLYISDLGSTNGTFVNGTKIEGSAWLAPGDVVKVGQSTLKVGAG
ncbi:MAG: FHA domain-containing protein, partial [Solirubrobacteraceae bacterium]